jgi:hypothetical protein
MSVVAVFGEGPLASRAAFAQMNDPQPIRVLLDLHADPLPGTPPVQLQVYRQWVAASDWLLDTAEPYGAKISFLSVGGFMEWALGDTVGGHPLVQRLYASGGQIGTHSHDEARFGVHDWRSVGMNPPADLVLKLWNDHVGMVNSVITTALGVSDPDEIKAINCSRGSHVPAEDSTRIQMMADFGFTIHQQGPDEQFYAYFRHYPMNPYRPSGAWMLQHDPDGPVVICPFGPVLGKNETHFGIPQDMRMVKVQGRFLLEVLNWLHDVHVAGSERVWVTGWAAHCSDVMAGTPTRAEYPPMLAWLQQHFINQPVGGQTAAVWSGVKEARDAYYVWEAAHPGEISFSYPVDETDWNLYPYLRPAVAYLVDASYEAAMPAAGTVRWHRLTASATAGGPYDLHVAYTTDGAPVVVDLSASLGSGEIAVVDPSTGCFHVALTGAVEVGAIGAILVPLASVVSFEIQGSGDMDGDGAATLADVPDFVAALLDPEGAGPAARCAADCNVDGRLDGKDIEWFVARLLS